MPDLCSCGRWAEYRCQFPVDGSARSQVCGRPLCAGCRVVLATVSYCAEHGAQVAEALALMPNRPEPIPQETNTMSEQIDLAALAEPFPAAAIGWKPQSINGSRALAIAYIDARDVMDRLDAVVGIGGWQDSYTPLPDGNVVCRLSIRLNGEWIHKEDVGGESDQKDEGDRRKAAFSDALKRAGIKWGIGRYLYRLEATWVDYDPQKKCLLKNPQLPPWALPRSAAPAKAKPATKPDDPKNGAELLERLELLDAWAVEKKLCDAGDVRESVIAEAKANRWPDDMTKWTPEQVRLGMAQARHTVTELQKRKKTETAA